MCIGSKATFRELVAYGIVKKWAGARSAPPGGETGQEIKSTKNKKIFQVDLVASEKRRTSIAFASDEEILMRSETRYVRLYRN